MENTNFDTLASDESIEKTTKALEEHNITVFVTQTGAQAREKVLSLIPENAEVMTASSVTLETLGIDKEVNESGKYNSVKKQLSKLNRETDNLQMQKIGAAPEYIIGSVHAVTEDGKVMIASNTGSQIPGYAYGSQHVIWIVSTKKIVKNMDFGFKRIYEHIVPLEDVHMKQLYGPEAGTAVRKVMIVNSEFTPNRITLILVKENLGF